ncbi:uncharacterized protein LOC110858458 [Folsomia candida]|uniref:uncharacterized protein LOC110858458 n=1 Tax=Folsomia candida TaxID=158441 RepID=UPI000B9077EC|nr:uncharacterized protein LOC110858458 [Folsomia candida]
MLADNWNFRETGKLGTMLRLMLLLSVSLTVGSSPPPLDEYEPLPVPMTLQVPPPGMSGHHYYGDEEQGRASSRSKRDITSDIFDAAGSLGVGEGYLKKFRALVEGTPPKMKDALLAQDFSNVTADDMRRLNITVIEYLPPKIIAKLNSTLLFPVVERLLQANKPIAMGRVMTAMGDKLDSDALLDKLQDAGGFKDSTEEAANVLLHTALNKISDGKRGLDVMMINRLGRERLLDLVPEEQLMKVRDSDAAKILLQRVYSSQATASPEHKDVDDQALIYKLVQTSYGKAEDWTQNTIKSLGGAVLGQLPASFLTTFNPEAVKNSMAKLSQTDFGSPLQAKAIADVFMKSVSGNISTTEVGEMGNLAAFINPESVADRPTVLHRIISSCENLNLPAPLKAVSEILKQKLQGGEKAVSDLDWSDMREMSGSFLKNSPPAVLGRAIELTALDPKQLGEIAGGSGGKGSFINPFFQGVISQVSAYAVKLFRASSTGGQGFRGLPAAFLGALGIRGIRDMSQRDMTDDLPAKLRDNPDALDDAQKAMLIKRLRDQDLLNTTLPILPPEIRGLLPRKGDGIPQPQPRRNNNDILDGLPSDAELRLAYGYGKKFTAADLERDPRLVGTLTPKQVMDMDIEEIPAVLAAVRESKDGPQQQTLAELSKRFAEYIRLKSEDFDSPDKKLLKYISAAEVSKLPATVLAYFIDSRQTAKLPPDVRKEIMIAMGELSTKDHAAIPAKTREEIILQGLAAIDKLTGGASKKLDVTELAAIGGSVGDLSPSRIESLTPVAAEQALEIIKGAADDDDDRLKQRACLNKEQRAAWRTKIIQLYGDPSKWDPSTVTSLCCVIGLLNENDMVAIHPEALATCRCASDSNPPSHLRELKKALDANCRHSLGGDASSAALKKTMDKVKSEIAFDLDDLESQIVPLRRRRRRNSESDNEDIKLTCFKVRVAGNAAHFSKEQLESLDPIEIKDCLYELGSEPLPHDHARILWAKLVKSKGRDGGVLQPDDIRAGGAVLGGIRLSDVNGLNLGDWDIVYPFGKTVGLSKNVLEKIASNLEEKQSKPLSQFDTNDLVVTRNILCGFSPERLSEIQIKAFRDALPVLSSLDPGCEQTRLAKLAGLTLRPEIFGPPASWGPADVRGTGILLVGLSSRDIESIPPEAFLGLSPSVAESLPSSLLEVLSPEQVEHIPQFSAQAMTSAQRGSLSSEAQEKLDSLVAGPVVSLAGSLNQNGFITTPILSVLLTAIFAHRILL